MIYTLFLCISISVGLCGQHRAFDYPTLQECEKARDAFMTQPTGKSYAICAPKNKDKP